jgi:hypothetical protein
MTISLNTDTTITVENILNPAAPTDYRTNMVPYLMMLLAGGFLLLIRRKRSAGKGGGSFND